MRRVVSAEKPSFTATRQITPVPNFDMSSPTDSAAAAEAPSDAETPQQADTQRMRAFEVVGKKKKKNRGRAKAVKKRGTGFEGESLFRGITSGGPGGLTRHRVLLRCPLDPGRV